MMARGRAALATIGFASIALFAMRLAGCTSFSGKDEGVATDASSDAAASDDGSAAPVDGGGATDASSSVDSGSTKDGGHVCAAAVAPSANLLVFMSSVGTSGNLQGLKGADALCQAEANDAGLGDRCFIAWLSSSQFDARARLLQHFASRSLTEYHDGQDNLIFASDAFTDAGEAYPVISIDNDPRGINPVATNVWTGSTVQGVRWAGTDPAEYCVDWTYGGDGGQTLIGSSTQNSGGWTDNNTSVCGYPWRLYCFEVAN